MFTATRKTRAHLATLALAAAACVAGSTLPDAQIPVAQQQINIYALSQTPVSTPSGYNMLGLAEVNVANSNNFDFVFDIGIDSVLGFGSKGDTVAVLIPRGALGFVADGGLQSTLMAFDSVLIAPVAGYEGTKPTRIRTGDVVLAASRRQTCDDASSHPRYAKLNIGAIDLAARSVVIGVIIDPNCGYRGLGSGIPTK